MTAHRPAQYFSETYADARKRFVDAVAQQGGTLHSNPLKDQPGRYGETLSTDTAWFGPPDADRVFVSISGTHGQEFFSGAAGQLCWVMTQASEPLPDNVAVCLIHCHNPYGASYNSRGNENFVDLNRNYFDPGKAIRPNALYEPLYRLLFTKDMSERILDEVMAAFYRFVEHNDTQKALTAMGGGQNTHPLGTLYCGHGDEASTRNLRALVDGKLCRAKQVALIDWHTGLGDFGDVTVMIDDPIHTETYRWACTWWGGPEASEAIQPKETAPDSIGMVREGMADQLRGHGAQVASAVVEIGTVDNEAVLGALLIDRWLRFECTDSDAPEAVRLRAMMMERLNPSLPSWRAKVIEHTTLLYAKSIMGLANWGR